MTRFTIGIAAAVLLLTTAGVVPVQAETLQLQHPRCEYKVNPIGLDVARPRLSWQLAGVKDDLRDLKQTAYQILVASSLEKLAGG